MVRSNTRSWLTFEEEVPLHDHGDCVFNWDHNNESELTDLFLEFCNVKGRDYVASQTFDLSPAVLKRKHFPDVVYCRPALPYETFSFLMAELENKKESISIGSTNALTQLSKYVRLTAVLSRLYERNIFYGLLFNGQSAVYLKIMLEEDSWKNFKFIYYYSKRYILRYDLSFNERLLSLIDHSSRSFPSIFQKIAPDHRYITMLKRTSNCT